MRQRPIGLQFFHQLLKRHVLVRIAAECSFSDAAQRFATRGIAGQICAQRERVDKESNQILGLGQRASRDRRPDHDVFLAGVAKKQELVRCQQHHERRDVFFLAEQPQITGELFRQRDLVLRAAKLSIRLRAWSWMICRQLQHRRQGGELLLPIRKLRFVSRTCKTLTLPFGVIGVLNRQFIERRRPAPRKRFVERRQLLVKDANRPAVSDNVVHGDDQNVFA